MKTEDELKKYTYMYMYVIITQLIALRIALSDNHLA